MNTRAELYGSGIFTTVRVVDGRPWLWEKHSRRLERDAAALGMDLTSFPEDSILERLEIRIAGTELASGRARITISDKRTSQLWPGTARNASAALSIQTAPLNPVARPFRLGTSQHRVNSTSPITGLKTGNYLEQIMALDEARNRSFNEAVRVNERGQITSACMANIFWLKDNRLFTPALSTGCLAGTTREFLMENVEVSEVGADLDELQAADAIFLTSAGLGVIAVDEFDGRAMDASRHDILALVPDTK